ncbi:MAG TPA: LamG domain-containing protein [Flavobacterium sp.]|nr:LamG domain-containing protein [Flavobacterium sp.]
MKKIYLLFLLLCGALMAQGPGKALHFDGVDDGISVATPIAGTVEGVFTVEAWVRPGDATKTMHILSSRAPAEYGFDLQILDGNKIHADIGNGVAWLTTQADATVPYQVGAWMHVAMTVTTNGWKLYANGTQASSGIFLTANPVLINASHSLLIGRHHIYPTEFVGSIDDVRIYNSELTQSAIQSDMSSATPVGASPVINYNFNVGMANGNNTGLNLMANTVSSNYPATLSGFALTGSTSNWTWDRYVRVLVNNTTLYDSLFDAFAAINNGAHTGSITITVLGDTSEPDTPRLAASGTGSTSYTSVTLSPLGVRTLSGNLVLGVLWLDGADNVLVDGLSSGGNSLLIKNTYSDASCVRLTNGASNNTIRNLSVTSASSTNSGAVSIGHDVVGDGANDSNVVSNCTIGANPGTTLYNGIYATGATMSTGTQLLNNRISGYVSTGIRVAKHSSTLISGNKLYQSSPLIVSASTSQTGIHVSASGSDATSHQITSNTIGYNTASGSGTYQLTQTTSANTLSLTGIYFNCTNTAQSTLSQNVIANIQLTGGNAQNGFIGINVENGNVLVDSNTIGSQAANDNITYNSTYSNTNLMVGIEADGSFATTVSNNNLGGLTNNSSIGAFYGIRLFRVNNGTAAQVSGNTIGGSSANSIRSLAGSTSVDDSYGIGASLG